MNKIILLIILVLFLGFVIIKYRSGFSPQKAKVQVTASSAPNRFGGYDDDGYWEWENTRLCDPETGKIPAHIQQREQNFAMGLPRDVDKWGNDTRLSGISTWTQVGPWNVGGRTRTLAIDVNNDKVIIAGAVSGTLYRSANGGQNWNPVSDPVMEPFGSSCITQDPRKNKSNIWYLGTGEAFGSSASGGNASYLGNGVYKSLDSGKTWSSLPSTAYNPLLAIHGFDGTWNLAVNPVNAQNDEVYCAAVGCIYKSLNGGTTWDSILGIPGNAVTKYTDIVITPKGVIYATLSNDPTVSGKTTGAGIWRSTDGMTFTNITPPTFPANYKRIVIAFAPSDETQVYFLANTPPAKPMNPGYGTPDSSYFHYGGGVDWNSLWKYQYVSGNGSGSGGTWTNLSTNIPTGSKTITGNFNSQSSYDIVVSVLPTDTNVVFIGGKNIFRSSDGFKTNTHIQQIGGYSPGVTPYSVNNGYPGNYLYPNNHPDHHVLTFAHSNSLVMYNGSDGGVYKTLNDTATTVKWISLDSGYVNSLFYTVAMDHAGSSDNEVIGGLQDNGCRFTNSANPSASWTFPCGGDGTYCAIADNKTMYYFANSGGTVYKEALDSKGNIVNLNRIDPIGAKGGSFVAPFALDPNNNNIMYLTAGNFIWRNSDLSQIPLLNKYDSVSTNWYKFPDSSSAGIVNSALAVSRANPANRLYYGTSGGSVYRLDSAQMYSGLSAPVSLYAGLRAVRAPGGYVSCIAVNPLNANNIIVVFSNYSIYSMYVSNDGGNTFGKCAGNLEQDTAHGLGDGPSCRWASIIPVSDGTVYMVATSTGLYATDTLMGARTVWVQQGSTSIGSGVCEMIDYRSTDGYVAVATHGKGIFTSYIKSIKDLQGIAESKIQQASLSVFPNPFTSSTTIQVNLNAPIKATVQVFDAAGKLMGTLLNNQTLSTGISTIPFNSSAYPSGVYYAVIHSEIFSRTQKMLILK